MHLYPSKCLHTYNNVRSANEVYRKGRESDLMNKSSKTTFKNIKGYLIKD